MEEKLDSMALKVRRIKVYIERQACTSIQVIIVAVLSDRYLVVASCFDSFGVNNHALVLKTEDHNNDKYLRKFWARVGFKQRKIVCLISVYNNCCHFVSLYNEKYISTSMFCKLGLLLLHNYS